MKNRNLFISTISAISGAAITLPLALTTASCSCSQNKFAGDDVLDKIYEPTIGQLGGTESILLSKGTEEWWDYLKNHKNMPQEEYRWTSSCMASLGKQLIQSLPQYKINISQWTGRLSNFKINNESEKRVSYVATQQISLDMNIQVEQGLKLFGESPLQSIKGHLGLSWRYEVKNTPIGCFDFDPSGLIGGQIYGDSETVWYIAPDLSSIKSGDDSWSISYDFLPDIDVTINDQEIIKLNNELQFSFDKTLASIIESGFSDADLPMAYFVERMIGLISGWNSYYLSQTKQTPHIDWDNSSWKNVTPDEDGFVTTGFGQTPIYDFKINDGSYSKDELYTTVIGLYINQDDPAWEFSINDIHLNPSLTHCEIVDYNNKTLSVGYDFYYGDELGNKRFAPGTSYDTLSGSEEPGSIKISYNVGLPVIATKDWISIGGIGNMPISIGSQTNDETIELIRLKEAAEKDQYIHDVEPGNKTREATDGSATISFPIHKALYEDWGKNPGKYDVALNDLGGKFPVVISKVELGKDSPVVNVNVKFDGGELNPGDYSNYFDLWFIDNSQVASGARIIYPEFVLHVPE